MSQQSHYEIEGRVGGPVTLVQLQLMAASGMLQPHHRIRKANSGDWYFAQSVKGLFSQSPIVPTASPAPKALPAGLENVTEPQFLDEFSQDQPTAEPEINPAFDFFSAPEPPPPPAKSKAKSPPPPSKPEPVTFELPRSDAQPPPAANPAAASEQSPFTFRLEPSDGAKLPPIDNQDTVLVLPIEELMPAENEKTASAPQPSAPSDGKVAESGPDPKATAKREQAPPAKSDSKTDPAVSLAPSKGIAIPSTRAEVTGHAIELLPDGCARPLDGKSVFRLHRSWLMFATKFNDNTARAVYFRLEQIDAATIEHRLAPARFKGGPYSILTFSAGEVHASLAFQGSDKLYRTFLERVLLQCNSAGKSSSGRNSSS
jgi:hypothetical protein